jgi:hypothetical protein
MGDSVSKVGAFCIEGSLEIGQTLIVATAPDGESREVRVVVLAIEHSGQHVNALGPVLSGTAVVRGDLGPAGRDWTLHTGPLPLPDTLTLSRIGPSGVVEPAAVTYQLLELPLFTSDDPSWTWQRLQVLLTKAEAQLYASWANDVWSERAPLAWQFFRAAGLAADPGSDNLLGLADFLLSWYPRVMEPYERELTPLGHPGRWTSALPATLELSLAHDLGFIAAFEVAKSRPGLSWGLKANKLVFPGGYGETLVADGYTVLYAALQSSHPDRAMASPRDPRSWAARRSTLRYATDVVLHEAEKVAAAPTPEPASPLLLGSFELPPGHRLVLQATDGGQVLLWATDQAVEDAGQHWTDINAACPEGHCCVLLGWGDYELNWEGAKLPRAATSPEAIAAIDPAWLLPAMWELNIPTGDEDDEVQLQQVQRLRAPFGREWPGLAPAGDSALGIQAIEAAIALMPPARVGVVATARLADLPGLLAWNDGVNSRPPSSELSAVLRSWEDRFGARLLRLGGATLDLLVERPPQDDRHAIYVAAEHYALCPDIIDQGVGTLTGHAKALVGAPLWHFWWD